MRSSDLHHNPGPGLHMHGDQITDYHLQCSGVNVE